MKIHNQFILLLAISFIGVTSVVSQLQGDLDSVCVETVSYSKTRNVSYNISYRTGGWWIFGNTLKYKTEYRTEYYTGWTSKEACCAGYQNENGTCKPKCSSNCQNGYCAAPNTCECNVGYELAIPASLNLCFPRVQ